MTHDLHVQSLDSPLWHRVAPLAPRLRTSVRVRYRPGSGGTRHLLIDPLSGRHHLVEPAAWAVIGLFDGQRNLGQIWRALQDRPVPAAPAAGGHPALRGPAGAATDLALPTQQEVIDWLVRLDAAGLLLCDQAPDIGALLQGQDRAERARRRAAAHPLSWRLPLGDPSARLARLAGLGRAVFHPVSALLWLGLLALAALQAGLMAPELQAALAQRLAQPHFLALAWAVYPLLKGLHELGHALAVRHFGGEVRQVGLAFIYLIPAPYVDASAATGFASRRQRLVVSAVGMAVELALAALGLLLWARLQPGIVRDLALAFAFVGGVSTVLANANPLVRMDGYHLLVDALDLPNLAARSRRHGLAALQRALLGRGRDDDAPAPTRRRERLLLPLYAPLSWAFGAAMGASTALWLAERAPLAGALVGALTLWALVLRPAGLALHWLLRGELAAPARARALGLSGAAAFALVMLLSVPLPHHSTAFGIAWAPEEATLRAPADGFVRAIGGSDGAAVTPGQPLIELVDDHLPLALAQTRSRRLEQDTLAYALQWRDPPRAQRAAIDAAQLATEEATLQARLERMRLPAPRAGTLHWLDPSGLPGRWVRRGEVLGHVLADDVLGVRLALPAERWPQLQAGVERVEVHGPALDARALPAHWSGRAEAPAHRLPAAALGSAAGGPIETDPADTDGLRTLDPVVVLDVSVPGSRARWLGQRLAVQFTHPPTALGPRLWRAAQQTVLQHLGGAAAAPAR